MTPTRQMLPGLMPAQATLGGPRTGPGVGEQPWETCLAPTCKKPCAFFLSDRSVRSCPVSIPHASSESSVTKDPWQHQVQLLPAHWGNQGPRSHRESPSLRLLVARDPTGAWACHLAALPTGPLATDQPCPCTSWPLPPHPPLILPPPPTTLLPCWSCNMPISFLPQGLCTCSLYLGCLAPIATFDTHFPLREAFLVCLKQPCPLCSHPITLFYFFQSPT